MRNGELDYRTRWNLIGEVRERLDGKNCFQFAKELGLFLKGGVRRQETEAEGPKRKLANALRKNKMKSAGFPVTYDQSLGLTELIKRALGPDNSRNFKDIIPEHFPLKGTDVRTVNVRVEKFSIGETGEQATKRLVAAGHVLANTGDLAGFLASHPKEVEKWSWVVALSGDSCWAAPDGFVYVPYTRVLGPHRDFSLVHFRYSFNSGGGVLVLCE